MSKIIKRVQIFGERNSGTNYVKELIILNFPEITFTTDYGWKHGFADIDKINNSDHSDDLFLCIFKDPYAWLVSMKRKPHHAPHLKDLRFTKFLRHEWSSYDLKRDHKRDINLDPLRSEEEIMTDRNPETGERIKNVIQLRNLKTKSFLQLMEHEINSEVIKYEDLLLDCKNTMDAIASKWNISKTSIFQDTLGYHGKNPRKTFPRKEYYLKKKYLESFSSGDLQFTNSQLEEKLENDLGYSIINTL